MNSDRSSFHTWLSSKIRAVFKKPEAWILWCDPRQEWLDLLKKAAEADGFELWADPEEHELVLRNRFVQEPRRSRIVWLPVSHDDITWFKVFEPEADFIWETSLLSALRDFGVQIPGDREDELAPLLATYAYERFDSPKADWKDFTAGAAKGELINDRRMLEVLAGNSGEFEALRSEGKFEIFARRAMEDFGLPDPATLDEEVWKREATAILLCTEAAAANPDSPPPEAERIIPPGLARDHALELLQQWQQNIVYIPSFERAVKKADAMISLGSWARDLVFIPKSKASRAVEREVFKKAVDRLQGIDDIDALAEALERDLSQFRERRAGFWGQIATETIGWRHLVNLGEVARRLIAQKGIEQGWTQTEDALQWYQSDGWSLDVAGETLFEEVPDLPEDLQDVRDKLRGKYLRNVDAIGRTFSDLLEQDSQAIMHLPTAGERALAFLTESNAPTAFVFLDALRLDLGHRLAELINKGEPEMRATVEVARAPIPSITALGKPYALPVEGEHFTVGLSSNRKTFEVTCEGSGNLVIAETWRAWLKEHMGASTCLSIEEILDGKKVKKASSSSRFIAVEGSEFDTTGHDGSLRLEGSDEHLERYTSAVRKLRDAGYRRVIIVTDHGFFHWQPDPDEIEEEKPTGEHSWTSRRVIVGRNLTHKTALSLPVSGSDLVAIVPRSVNAFRTYGGLGFFHGGATLQELVIPIVRVQWPAKAKKVNVVLKPVGQIASEMPRVQIEPGVAGQQRLFGADAQLLARKVYVKIKNPQTGRVIFRHDNAVTIEPGGSVQTVTLTLVDAASAPEFGSQLLVLVQDADDEEQLTEESVTLKVEIDEFWS